jgi:hypothetical protein
VAEARLSAALLERALGRDAVVEPIGDEPASAP